MTKYRNSKEPQMHPFRVLKYALKAEAFTLDGNTILPKGEHILPEGTRLEVIRVQGKLTAVGLLGETRVSRTQQFTMLRVNSRLLFENSSSL